MPDLKHAAEHAPIVRFFVLLHSYNSSHGKPSIRTIKTSIQAAVGLEK